MIFRLMNICCTVNSKKLFLESTAVQRRINSISGMWGIFCLHVSSFRHFSYQMIFFKNSTDHVYFYFFSLDSSNNLILVFHLLNFSLSRRYIFFLARILRFSLLKPQPLDKLCAKDVETNELTGGKFSSNLLCHLSDGLRLWIYCFAMATNLRGQNKRRLMNTEPSSLPCCWSFDN